MPQKAVRGCDLALSQERPDRAGGHRLGSAEGLDDPDLQAVAGTGFLKEGRRSAALLAEMKVPAHHDRPGVEPPDQDIGDELFGGQVRERGIEGELDHARQPFAGQKQLLFRRGAQARYRLVGAKKTARMRLESERDRRKVRSGFRAGRRENLLVTEMDAVEISNGHGPARQRGRQAVKASLQPETGRERDVQETESGDMRMRRGPCRPRVWRSRRR